MKVAVASPSRLGSVARMTSVTVASWRRLRFTDPQIARTDVVDADDRPAEHVVEPPKLARPFDGTDVVGGSSTTQIVVRSRRGSGRRGRVRRRRC